MRQESRFLLEDFTSVKPVQTWPGGYYWGVAQLVERQTLTLKARGSKPCTPAKFKRRHVRYATMNGEKPFWMRPGETVFLSERRALPSLVTGSMNAGRQSPFN